MRGRLFRFFLLISSAHLLAISLLMNVQLSAAASCQLADGAFNCAQGCATTYTCGTFLLNCIPNAMNPIGVGNGTFDSTNTFCSASQASTYTDGSGGGLLCQSGMAMETDVLCVGSAPAATPVPTPVPTPCTTTSAVACICGTPPPGAPTGGNQINAADGSAVMSTTVPYADSCGNLVCSWTEACAWQQDSDDSYTCGTPPSGDDFCQPTVYNPSLADYVGGGTHTCHYLLLGVSCGSSPYTTGLCTPYQVFAWASSGGTPAGTTVACTTSPTPSPTPSGAGSTPTPTPTPAPSGSFSASSVNFGSVLLNTSSTAATTVTFTNNGSVSANGCILSALSGTNPSDFTDVDPGCGSIAANGGTCSVAVTGFPKSPGAGNSAGNKSASLTMTCQIGLSSVSATATLTEIEQTPPSFTFSPNTYDFLTQGPGTAQNQSVQVTNSGTLGGTSCVISLSDLNFSETDNCGTINGTNVSGNTCMVTLKPVPPSSGTIGTIYTTTITEKCTGTDDANYPPPTNIYSGVSGNFTYTLALCSAVGQFIPAGGVCQCPVGYEVTSNTSEGSACRPIIPSLEFFKSVSAPYPNDGFPSCGTGRVPTGFDYSIFNFASNTPPHAASFTTNTLLNPPYNYKYSTPGTPSASGTNPLYFYSNSYSNTQRCVCGNNFAPAATPVPASTEALLPAFTSPGLPRFYPDTYDTIIQQTASAFATGTTIPYGQVAIASDNSSNGYLGNVYETGSVACGCPNLNEQVAPIDPTNLNLVGSLCKPMMATTGLTPQYTILPTYNPTVHASLVVNPDTPAPALTNAVTNVQLPTSSQGYQNYKRKIWTCAPPLEQVVTGTTITCNFVAAHNNCDDGSGPGGTVSAVSMNTSPGTGNANTPFNRFTNTVNKRLACCVNDFDPTNPNASEKFDCIDNSAPNTYSTFDVLWESATSDGLSNAVALTSASGQPMTGFYTMSGSRCSEFSEFAGTITPYKVNQMLKSSQQTLAGSGAQTDIASTNGTPISQPQALTSSAGWSSYLSSKSIPQTAADMRRCPILVRAAMQATCPSAPGAPPLAAGSAYPSLPTPLQTYNDGGTTRCSAASQVNILLRVEQIYEIAGTAKMSTIDSVTDSRQAVQLPVSDWIKSKTAGLCADGAVLLSDGSCAYQ
jgi:hypothetical protein